MEIVGATEAGADGAALLHRVSDIGEWILIEHRGKPSAVLMPLEDPERTAEKNRPARRETERPGKLGH